MSGFRTSCLARNGQNSDFFFKKEQEFLRRWVFAGKKKRTKGRKFVWSRKKRWRKHGKNSEEDNHCSSMYKGEEKKRNTIDSKG